MMHNVSTGTHVETGNTNHAFLSSLLQQKVAGIDHLVFVMVTQSGVVELLHSLFVVPTGEYNNQSSHIWAM